jgi:hypothetical protein
MARIYDPISGKTLTESQINNRINSPNLGGAYAKAGVTSVADLKNYNPSQSTSTNTSTASSSWNPSSNPSPNTGSTASVSSGPVANKSTSPNVKIISKTMTKSQYDAMINDPNYRYTAGDDTAFTKITIVNDTSGQVFTERLITPKLREDGTKYEAWGRSTSFGFGDNSSYGKTAEEAASIWAKQNSKNPGLAAEGYQQKAKVLIDLYVGRGVSEEVATKNANRLTYNSVKAVSDITGLDFKMASALQAGGVIREGRNLDAIVEASKVGGKLNSSAFLNNMRIANAQVINRGIRLDPISTERDAQGNPVDPNAIINAQGQIVDGRLAQNRPELVQVSQNLYINKNTGYVVATDGNGAGLTQATSGTLNQMWAYGIGKDQFQQARDFASNNNIKIVGLEQSTVDAIDWDSVETAQATSFLKNFQNEIEKQQTVKSPEPVVPEAVVPGTTTVATPQPDYTGTTPTATEPSTQETTPTEQQTTTQQPLSTTPYTPTPTTITGESVDVGVTPTGVYPQAPVTGTMSTPVQTAGLGAVPQTIQVRDNYTGTTMQNLTSQSQQGFGGQRTYVSPYGQEMLVTVDAMGKPITYVPPDYTLKMAEGGSVSEGSPDVQLARKFLGFDGPASQLTNFLGANPAAAARMGKYLQAMSGMAKNRVGADPGTVGTTLEDFANMQGNLVKQTMQPTQSTIDQIVPAEADMIGTTAGQTTSVAPQQEVGIVGNVTQSQMPMTTDASTYTATTTAGDVQAETAGLTAQTGTVSDQAQVTAQQQLTTSVSGMEAAQGTATMVNAPAAREIQDGELISGVANAEKAATFNEQIQAATATPTKQATVAGQLEGLMQQFEGGNTPPWAAGSMRTAMATLAARGLGASSMAGQAVIQAAMEAALPIAQADANITAQFEAQNLSNRQQRAMLAAQQRAQFLGQEFDQAFQARVQNSARIADIANMNFNAEQQIALENSRAANSMNMANLTNRQAMVMAEAAALANLDMANLNNRQQAAVQNAQNFLQMDMANLSNNQQTAMFKAQQNIQALFTDQAAENAACVSIMVTYNNNVICLTHRMVL